PSESNQRRLCRNQDCPFSVFLGSWSDTPPAPRPLRKAGRLFYVCTSLDKQLQEDRAMATGLLRAIAADRKIGMVRQCRKEIKRLAVRWRSHLCPVFFHEDRPFARRRRALRQRDRSRTWRKIWKPDVVPVLRCVVSLRNATRRPSNRANS